MRCTPANSIAPPAAHPLRIGVLSEHRESTDLFRSLSASFRPCREGLPPIRPSIFLPLDSSQSFLQHFRAPFEQRSARCESPFPQAKMGIFCTILVQSKSFGCNTSEPPPKWCKQRTYRTPKPFTC